MEDLAIIVFRQPKRKEEILHSVWGSLYYYSTFDSFSGPAIVLEAQDYSKNRKWGSKSLRVDSRQELERLRKDGHVIVEDKRGYSIELKLENVRATQLFRTLLHEIGHYVQYLELVTRPLRHLRSRINSLEQQIDWDSDKEEESFKLWDKLWNEESSLHDEKWHRYDNLPSVEKEQFAHRYAEKLYSKLAELKVIPFPRILDLPSLERDQLRVEDFVPEN